MKKIDIQITKAEISSFQVKLEDGVPEVMATIACYTEDGKKVTTFTVSTQQYYGSVNFELPLQMIQPIVDIAQRLESVVIVECNKAMAQLPPPKEDENIAPPNEETLEQKIDKADALMDARRDGDMLSREANAEMVGREDADILSDDYEIGNK